MRIVDPEYSDTVAHPELEDAQALQIDPVAVVVEVDRIDVLVLLRRILCVRDCAVGALGEPLRGLGDPRMIRRGLECEVQCNLEPKRLGFGDESVEGVKVAEVRMDGVVSAFFGADRPGRPWVGWGRRERIVRSLAIRPADWVDGREVDHIEAHRRRSLKPLVGAVERAGNPPLVFFVPLRTLGAREELIPGGEQGRAAIGEDRVILGGRYQLPWAIAAPFCAYTV